MGLKPATNPDVEAATIELNIDGKTVTAKDGVSLYDVIAMTGKIIPAMCYHYTFDPFGSCGMCLVMQEGKKAPVRSCTAKATAGMIIRTEGEDLFLARKKAVEKAFSTVLGAETSVAYEHRPRGPETERPPQAGGHLVQAAREKHGARAVPQDD